MDELDLSSLFAGPLYGEPKVEQRCAEVAYMLSDALLQERSKEREG